jgi:hypothetical protein
MDVVVREDIGLVAGSFDAMNQRFVLLLHLSKLQMGGGKLARRHRDFIS